MILLIILTVLIYIIGSLSLPVDKIPKEYKLRMFFGTVFIVISVFIYCITMAIYSPFDQHSKNRNVKIDVIQNIKNGNVILTDTVYSFTIKKKTK